MGSNDFGNVSSGANTSTGNADATAVAQSTPPAQSGEAPNTNSDKQPTGEQTGQGGTETQPDGSTQTVDGQGQKPPEKKPEEKPATAIDPQYHEYLRNKGIDPEKFDPHKVIDMYQHAERELTKIKQLEKAKETQKEAEKLIPPKKEEQVVEVTPLQEFQTAHDFYVNQALESNGVSSFDELLEVNPKAWAKLSRAYTEGLFAAREKEAAFQAKKVQEQVEKQNRQIQFQNDLKAAEDLMNKNLAAVRKEYPDYDKDYKASGLDEFYTWLEDVQALPRTYILSNPKFATLNSKLVKAMSILNNYDFHVKKAQDEYDKKLKEQSKAVLPAAGGSADTSHESTPKFNNTGAQGRKFF